MFGKTIGQAIAKAAAGLAEAGIPAEQFEPVVQTIQMGDHIEHEKLDRPIVKRTHHAFLHPRKGWRNFARPSGTNRRRRLIRMGALSVSGCHEYRRTELSGGRTAPACKFR